MVMAAVSEVMAHGLEAIRVQQLSNDTREIKAGCSQNAEQRHLFGRMLDLIAKSELSLL